MTHSAQFQAVLGAKTLAKTPHFALHQASLQVLGAACARAPRPKAAHAGAASAAATADATGQPNTPEPSAASIWGVITPKRWAKRAVTRNAIKRQMLAVASAQGMQLQPAAYVLRQRAAFDPKQYPSARSMPLLSAVRAELEALLQSARRP
jgi:ribonuclease P protein component